MDRLSRVMRLLSAVLVALCCIGCHHSREVRIAGSSKTTLASDVGDGGENLVSWFAGVRNEFTVSTNLLERSKWVAERDPLPLTPKRAELAAVEEARKLRPDVSDWATDDIELHRFMQDCWYYEVRLLRADQVVMGLPPANFYQEILVFMNGTAVHSR